ncbi:MAG: GerMN domain-containing protein [Spirochaetes bacterium]|nr:GerMN domain-containing protein [Spirochaetota bacterium]
MNKAGKCWLYSLFSIAHKGEIKMVGRGGRSGFLFMLIVLVLLGVIVYAYREKFIVLLNTGYSTGRDVIEKNFGKKKDKEIVTEKITLLDKKNQEVIKKKIIDGFEEIKEKIDTQKVLDNIRKKNEKNTEIQKENKDIYNESKKDAHEKKDVKTHFRRSLLYYSVIQDNEKLKLVSVSRSISYTNTPLTQTLKSLLNGPVHDGNSSEIITNIPHNTKLLSVVIKDNTAYINFSKEFEFNSYGRESTIAQIKQVVYTATEFSNVKSVQILINGRVKTYLGGEGVVINKPLSRDDFS